jgi:hypothetical protein
MIDNPFKEFEEANDDVIPSTIPHFPRTVSIKIKISEEALYNLSAVLSHVHQGSLIKPNQLLTRSHWLVSDRNTRSNFPYRSRV